MVLLNRISRADQNWWNGPLWGYRCCKNSKKLQFGKLYYETTIRECILTRFFFSKIKVEKTQFSNEIYQSGTQWPTDLVTWYTMRGLIPPSPGRNRVKTQLYRHLRFPFSVHMKYALITHEGNRWFVHLMVSIGMAVFWKKKPIPASLV